MSDSIKPNNVFIGLPFPENDYMIDRGTPTGVPFSKLMRDHAIEAEELDDGSFAAAMKIADEIDDLDEMKSVFLAFVYGASRDLYLIHRIFAPKDRIFAALDSIAAAIRIKRSMTPEKYREWVQSNIETLCFF